MTQYLFFMVDYDEYFEKLQNFTFCGDVECMSCEHAYEHLHRRYFPPVDLMTGILQNQQQLLAILKQVIETLNYSTDGHQGFVE